VSDGAWRISPLAVEDADELGAVHVRVWQEAYAGVMAPDFLARLEPGSRAEMWRALAASPRPRAQTLVARAPDERIAGFISVGPCRDEDAPTRDELYAINLLSEVHGTGLAQELLDRGLGDRDATLWMAEDNLRARRFYLRNGFVPEGARKHHPGSGVPEIRMVRRREPQRGVTAS
jgi:ribosomal protein S18 acetylase RimI-like enzyme